MPSLSHSLLVPLFPLTHAASNYLLSHDYFSTGSGSAALSFDNFVFQDAPDPTNGYVNYVSQSDAVAQGLAQVLNGNQIYLGADSSSVAADPGRNSTRLESRLNFTNGLIVADIAHMPGGACGIWPALWTFNFAENPYSEIDIIEGDMHNSDYEVSLHTCGACSFNNLANNRTDCNMGGDVAGGCPDASVTNGGGCGVTSPANTFGDAWNAGGGGVFAALISSTSVKIWTWHNGSVPADVAAGSPDPTSDAWVGGLFADLEGGDGCDVGEYFKEQSLIINIDFCGSEIDDGTWSGDTQCAGKGDCKTFVRENPDAFKEAYWLFNSIRLYQTS